jgi:protein pelota
LRIHGVVFEVPENIGGRGSFHTLDIVPNKPVSIVKNEWKKYQLDRLDKAGCVTAPPVIIASLDDEEYCIAILRQYGVEVKAEKRIRLPGKLEAEKREGAIKDYFRGTLQALREIWISLHSPIVIIGPSFFKNDFAKYVQSESHEINTAVVDIKSVNSAGIVGIQEALRSGVLTKALNQIRIGEETRLVEEVLARLGKGTNDVTYGLEDVTGATRSGAVERLLLIDTMLRETSDEQRLHLENIMREVETKGGQVTVVSTEHEAGDKLRGLTGIAALLRYPIYSEQDL